MSVFNEDIVKIAKKCGFLDKKTVFITGATGLIGSITVRALIKSNISYGTDINIVVFVRNKEKAYSMFGDNVKYVVGDITSPINYDGSVDYVIHLASETASANLVSKPVEVINTAVNGTLNVCDFANKKKVFKLVYASSMEAYGVVNSKERTKEDSLGFIDLNNVRSCYPESKRLSELIVKSYYKEYGLKGISARLAQTFGAGVSVNENRVFMQFAKSVINGTDIVLHTMGDSVGNYSYTTDTVSAILLLLQKGADGETYNICNESSTMTVKEMAKLCADEISGKIKVVFDIPEENKYGYAPSTALKLSGEKLYALGFKPEYDLKESYLRLIEDIKERL